MSTTAREEILLELFRAIDAEQRAELLKGLRALVEANRITSGKMKGPLRVVGNVRIEARYGLPNQAKKKAGKKSSRPDPRAPDRGLDDAQGS